MNGENSNVGSTELGVPQGGILSCILFALLINDLPIHLTDTFVILFADDTNFVVTDYPSNIDSLLNQVKTTMLRIINCIETNFLQLNVNKTQMIVIGKPSIVKSLGTLSVVIGNTLITSSVKLKILGLIIDSSLSWADHVSTKLKTCNSVL